MAQHIFDLLRTYLAQYGYWAVAVALLLENAGLPVPGESVLLLASFLAFSEHRLHFPYIIVVGICAATLGDNIGFAIGYYGGPGDCRADGGRAPHALAQVRGFQLPRCGSLGNCDLQCGILFRQTLGGSGSCREEREYRRAGGGCRGLSLLLVEATAPQQCKLTKDVILESTSVHEGSSAQCKKFG